MAFKRGGKRKQALRAAIIRRDGEACQYCGTNDNLSLDHIIPTSLGGPDCKANLQLLCRRCNGKRGNGINLQISSVKRLQTARA